MDYKLGTIYCKINGKTDMKGMSFNVK